MRARLVEARNDIVGGLVSAAVAIPLAMGYGMFAFVALGDAYFAHGVLAGLYTAIVVGVVSVATGDRTTTVYAPRIVTTFFLGSLVFSLAHSDAPIIRTGHVEHTLAIVFSIILVGGAFQALFGLVRLGTLIRHTPQPVMAGFQNAAALLLFLVQLGNVLGYGTHTRLGHRERPLERLGFGLRRHAAAAFGPVAHEIGGDEHDHRHDNADQFDAHDISIAYGQALYPVTTE